MGKSIYKFNMMLLFKYPTERGKSALGSSLCRAGTIGLSNKWYKVICDIVTHLLECLLKFLILKQVVHHR